MAVTFKLSCIRLMNFVNHVNHNSHSLFDVTPYLVSFYAAEAVNTVERHNFYGNVQDMKYTVATHLIS